MDRRRFLEASALSVAGLACRPRIRTIGPLDEKAHRAEDYDRAFTRERGWTGADGAYSVRLHSGVTLWLFSDTLVGEVVRGRRALSERVDVNALGARIVHSSSALQANADPESIDLVIRGGLEAPRSLFVPPDGEGWFWVNAAIPAENGGATVLLNQFVLSDDPAMPFGKQKGLWAVDVTVHGRSVRAGHYQRIDSVASLPQQPETVFGAAVLEDGTWTYLYGARGDTDKQLVIAGVPSGQLDQPGAYRFFDGETWRESLEDVRTFPLRVANEFSVHGHEGGYLMTSCEMSGPITLRYSASPLGPWGTPVEVWRPTELTRTVYSYNAKAHPELTDATGLLVSYNVNSFDLDESLHQADVYRPRFIRVPLERLNAARRASTVG